MNKLLLTNTGGKKDLVMTLLVISFIIVSASLIFGMFSPITIFGKTIEIRQIGSGEIASYFGVLLTGYLARRQGWGSKIQEKGENSGPKENTRVID